MYVFPCKILKLTDRNRRGERGDTGGCGARPKKAREKLRISVPLRMRMLNKWAHTCNRADKGGKLHIDKNGSTLKQAKTPFSVIMPL
jgi:hypothetical protein